MLLEKTYKEYNNCTLCPRQCGANRNNGEMGFCGAGALPEVNRIGLHFMEEPVISGTNGSGTVFFTHCTLGCIFCQNRDISRRGSKGKKYTADELVEEYLKLEKQGAHNINLVSPTHYMPTVLESCKTARKMGLKIPFVYNTGGFERGECIKRLNGIIDIFLTDLKYYSPYLSGRYSGSEDYYDYAFEATEEMVKITGAPTYSPDGMLQKGTVIRHLILPGQISDTLTLLRRIAKHFGNAVEVSLMRQYTPMSPTLPDELNRTVTDEEYKTAVEEFELLGLSGFLQEADAVGTDKIPKFEV